MIQTEGLEPGIWQEHLEAISELVEQELGHLPRAEILEGGCGSGSWVRFPKNVHLTGIDLSSEQLARNTRIHERIQGDLQTYPYPREHFDAVVCWDVLEHLDDPSAALDGFARAIRHQGLLILGFPDRTSLKGRLTRLLPYRAHVWVYRSLLGIPDAGTGDRGPFPTPMRPEMSIAAVVSRMESHGFTVVTSATYESPLMMALRRRLGLIEWRWTVASRAVAALTAGRIRAETTDCMLVMRKNGAPA